MCGAREYAVFTPEFVNGPPIHAVSCVGLLSLPWRAAGGLSSLQFCPGARHKNAMKSGPDAAKMLTRDVA